MTRLIETMQKIKDLLYRLANKYTLWYEQDKALHYVDKSPIPYEESVDGTTKDMWNFDYASNQEAEIVKGYEQSK